MSEYIGKIKVVNAVLMCFPVDPVTLEPLRCAVYDARPWYEPDAVEIIDAGEWNWRRAMMRDPARHL